MSTGVVSCDGRAVQSAPLGGVTSGERNGRDFPNLAHQEARMAGSVCPYSSSRPGLPMTGGSRKVQKTAVPDTLLHVVA